MKKPLWIGGGIVVAAIIVFVTFLAVLGWDEATTAETSPSPATSSETERGNYVTDKTGGRDPEQLREFHPDGQVLPASVLDELAQSVCRAQSAGAPPAEVADTIAGTGTMDRGEATMFGMAATLEFCPDLA